MSQEGQTSLLPNHSVRVDRWAYAMMKGLEKQEHITKAMKQSINEAGYLEIEWECLEQTEDITNLGRQLIQSCPWQQQPVSEQ